MALPLQQGLITSEVAFLCEMELVSIVPRQRLDSIDLLSVGIPRESPFAVVWPEFDMFFRVLLQSSARHIGLTYRSGSLSY